MRVKAEPWVIHRLPNKGEGVIPRAHWPSDVSTNAIKRRPREPVGTIGIVARAAGAGAVLIGFAIGANSVHDGSLTLATASASRGPAVTDKCTDNPADPSCPPMGPNDVKCAGAWRYTAACVGGPFDPNNIHNCAPVFVGCPGYVPNTPPPTPPSIEPPSHDKGHEPPPPHHHEPGSPPGTGHRVRENHRQAPTTRVQEDHRHPLATIRNPARLGGRHIRRKRRRHRLLPRLSHPLDPRQQLRLRTHPMSRRR